MMSKKKWFALLIIFIVYLLLGASFFYKIESEEENQKRVKAEDERRDIVDTLQKLFNTTQPEQYSTVMGEIAEYCGKPLLERDKTPLHWDYYHSVFFAVTVVTTIGYGNLAPTTTGSRIFMIVYGLIGIPVNGILFATLGEYFGKTFIRIYRKWKNNRVKHYAANLSLISQIILYLIPGLILFLFLPAIVIQHFEQWNYVQSVYYAFVTLTTIGFGDYVAGVTNNKFNELYFILYQVFLIVWIIFGLGYLVMVIGFMTRGLRSKRMAKLEKQFTQNIKTTHTKIWHGLLKDFTYLRRIMNELYLSKFKPVYRDDYGGTTPPKQGSQSFPDLRKLISAEMSPKMARRRAFSECISSRPLTRVQSDSDLHRIDKEATFASLGIVQPHELLANVATALTKSPYNEESEDEGGYHGLSDSEILASEMYGSGWTINSQDLPMQPPKSRRCRAVSEVKIPEDFEQDNTVDWTWSGPAATQKIQEIRQRTKFNKTRTKTRDVQNKSVFDKIKSSWSKTVDEEMNKQIDIEKNSQYDNTVHSTRSIFSAEQERYINKTGRGRHSVFSVPESRVLEETSVADLLRALSSIHSRVGSATEISEPHRKLGTASLTPPKVPSIINLFSPQNRPNMSRRASAIPSISVPNRRFSLHPVSEDQLMVPPPPYTSTPSNVSSTPSSQSNLVHKQISRLRGPTNSRLLYARTRHDSLQDLRIEKP